MTATCTGLTGLTVLLACVTGLRSSQYSLRERPPSSCGFAHYGSAVGSAQRLVETHLAPGVADWNIVVPMPPPCADAQVTGADMRVCDADAPPDVSMSDARSARVHRPGQLAGYAAVNVTVYCILPPPPQTSLTSPIPSPPPTPPSPPTSTSIAVPLSYLTDPQSTYEMLSNELNSKEEASNEETSYESESIDLTSAELTTIVKPTSSTTLPPPQEETTAQVALTLPTEVVTHPPIEMNRPKEKIPPSLKVIINITPNKQVPTEEDVSQPYDVELPSLSTKKKLNVVSSQSSSVPHMMTPPRFAKTPPRFTKTPPRKNVKQSRGPGTPAQFSAALHHQLGAHRPHGAHSPPRVRKRPPLYPPAVQYAAMPPPYELMSPYSVAPVYRPFSLLGPRLRFLQLRQPVWFFRHL